MASKSGPARLVHSEPKPDPGHKFVDLDVAIRELDARTIKLAKFEAATTAKLAKLDESLQKTRKRLRATEDARADAELELFSSSCRGTIRGIASTPDRDLVGHVIERGALKYSLPFPLRDNHGLTIGVVTDAVETDAGLEITGQVADSAAFKSPAIRKRLDDAWAALEAGRRNGLSICTRGLKPDANGVCKSATIVEISIGALPINEHCVIKSISAAPQRMRQPVYFEGPYRDGMAYESGSLVQHGGTVWVSTVNKATSRPGTSGEWRMLIKTGRNSEAEQA